MVSIDLYRNFPSIRRRKADTASAARKAAAKREREREMKLNTKRHTTLDNVVHLGARKAHRADPGRMGLLLSQLVEVIEGKDLSSIFGFNTTPSPAYGRLVGLNLSENQFASFLDGFIAAVGQLGLVGPVPAARAGRHESATDDRCRAALPSAMGVRVRTRRDTPRAVTRFDEFAAFMVGVPSLQAAIDAGMGDGLPPGLLEVTNALLGAIAAAVRVNDAGAIRRIGGDFGSLAAALFEATRGGEGTGRALRVRGGPVLVRRLSTDHTSRAIVKHVDFDVDDFVYDSGSGDYTRKKRRKRKLTKV